MEEKFSKSSIVIVGAWNVQIFSPSWLKDNNITCFETIKTMIELSSSLRKINYELEHVDLVISEMKLILSPRKPLTESYSSIMDIAKRILEMLPHTPISALGFNFLYEEKELSQQLFDLFKFKDDDDLSDKGYILKERTIKRTILVQDLTLNLTQSIDDENKVKFNFNWDFKNVNSEKARDILNNYDFITIKRKSNDFIKEVYGVEISDGE